MSTRKPRKTDTPAPPKPGDHGRALMTYLDAELAGAGVAPTTWARSHGITATNLSKWREGQSDPTAATVVHIATALGRRPAELMIAARYIDPDDVGVTVIAPEPVPDVRVAIEKDPELNGVQRGILRAAYQMGVSVRNGTINEQTAIIPPES